MSYLHLISRISRAPSISMCSGDTESSAKFLYDFHAVTEIRTLYSISVSAPYRSVFRQPAFVGRNQ